MIELRGERVTVRPLRPEEIGRVIEDSLPAWVAWGSDPQVARGKIRDRLERSGELTEHGLDLGIEVDDRLVGDVQARADSLPKGAFELGVGLFDERDRRQGIGREAVALLTAHLFESMGARRVQITTDVANEGMRRVAERLGFVHEGDLRGFWPEDDGDHDYAMYGMTRTEYERAAGGMHGPGLDVAREPAHDAGLDVAHDAGLDGDQERRKEVRRWT
jgi:RimJ/RimL family protein N-acetyltransferase